ncbi:MAG: hypothetical protein R3C05_11790 [Pirellulaceae bacterium]
MLTTRGIINFSVVISNILLIQSGVKAQQALIGGERIISVGPVISRSSQPLPTPVVQSVVGVTPACPEGDCGSKLPDNVGEKSVLLPPPTATPQPAAKSDGVNISEAKDWEAEFRKARSEHQHDMNQVSQRIEHLTEMVEKYQRRAEQLAIAEEKITAMQLELDAKSKQQVSCASALKAAEQMIANLKADQEKLSLTLKLRDDEVKQQAEIAKKLEVRHATLVSQLDAKSSETVALKKQNALLIEQNEGGNIRQKELEDEIETLKTKLKRLEPKKNHKPRKKRKETKL